jgi:hypothetical protein
MYPGGLGGASPPDPIPETREAPPYVRGLTET